MFYAFIILCFGFSRSWSFSIVERGTGSVEVKVLPVSDCCSYWFDFVEGLALLANWCSSRFDFFSHTDEVNL